MSAGVMQTSAIFQLGGKSLPYRRRAQALQCSADQAALLESLGRVPPGDFTRTFLGHREA